MFYFLWSLLQQSYTGSCLKVSQWEHFESEVSHTVLALGRVQESTGFKLIKMYNLDDCMSCVISLRYMCNNHYCNWAGYDMRNQWALGSIIQIIYKLLDNTRPQHKLGSASMSGSQIIMRNDTIITHHCKIKHEICIHYRGKIQKLYLRLHNRFIHILVYVKTRKWLIKLWVIYFTAVYCPEKICEYSLYFRQ